jgi:hypothetical protein
VTKHLLAWWDRQVVETLTGERTEPLHADEVRIEVVKRTAILLDNGFFEDTETYYGEIEPSAPGVTHQLDFINATPSQRNRSVPVEMTARAQRAAWMKADISKANAIRKYDNILIKEWSYRFGEKVDKCVGADDAAKMSHGRALLDWSHFNAPLEVRRIDPKYENPDLIRGSYLYLSGLGSVGWHPDYKEMLQVVLDDKQKE